jgi:hypothetical protein
VEEFEFSVLSKRNCTCGAGALACTTADIFHNLLRGSKRSCLGAEDRKDSTLPSCHPERSWRSRSEGQRSRRTPVVLAVSELSQGVLTMLSRAFGRIP